MRPLADRRSGPWPDTAFDPGAFVRLAPLVQERVATLGEVPGLVDFVFLDQPAIDEEAWAKTLATDPEALSILSMAIDAYGGLVDSWTHDELHVATLAVADGVGRKLGKAQAPIRVAVTGKPGRPSPVRIAGGAGTRADPRAPADRPPAGWRPVGRDRRPAGVRRGCTEPREPFGPGSPSAVRSAWSCGWWPSW